MPDAIPDLVRCPECGAGNPAGALWCGQCLRRFDAGADAARPSVSEPSPEPGGRPIVHTLEGGTPVWTCPTCGAENPLEGIACARCGSAFASFFADGSATVGPRVSASTARLLTAALPGSGHWAFHQVPAAVARGLLYVWSLGISVMLLAKPPATARALVRGVGVVFALSASGIWLLSMMETTRLVAGDRRPLIPPKALTWVTAALSSLLFFGLLGAVIAGR